MLHSYQSGCLKGFGSTLKCWALFCGTPGDPSTSPRSSQKCVTKQSSFRGLPSKSHGREGRPSCCGKSSWQMRNDAMQALWDAPAPGPLFHAQWRDEGTSSGH